MLNTKRRFGLPLHVADMYMPVKLIFRTKLYWKYTNLGIRKKVCGSVVAKG